MKKYYCNCESCKFAVGGWTGDGWHEPHEYSFDCENEDSVEDAEWTDDPQDELCPVYEYEDKDI